MKKNKVYVVTRVQIENWDEGGAFYLVVFARSRTQAAAAFAAEMDELPEYFGIDEANPDDPYVYRVKITDSRLRFILSGEDYKELVLEPGAKVLNRHNDQGITNSIMRIFMGGANHDHHHR